MRPVRRPSPRRAAPRFAAALSTAAVLAVAGPAANAQLFGLQPDTSGAPAAAPAQKRGTFASWLNLTPETGVAPASHEVCHEEVCHEPAVVVEKRRPASRFHLGGLVPDDGGAPIRQAKPVYPPGTRQKEHGGLLWPPFPRSTAPPASAKTQFHHAHYWPLPYTCQDRAYVRALGAAQVAAGRAEHSALHGFHFDPETHLLTSAGRDLLRTEVLAAAAAGTVSPIVVERGQSHEVGVARLVAVQEAVSEMGAPQLAAAVSLGITSAAGRPAEEIDRLRRDELQSTPQPRIPVSAVNASAPAN